jgi:hypothetical protein
MPNTVEITMTSNGYEVRVGAQINRFRSVDDALDFASQRLRWASDLRELSWHCE